MSKHKIQYKIELHIEAIITYKNISFVVLIPIVIEILQYIFATGALDINDIILNTVSGLIGVLIFAIIKKLIKK